MLWQTGNIKFHPLKLQIALFLIEAALSHNLTELLLPGCNKNATKKVKLYEITERIFAM